MNDAEHHISPGRIVIEGVWPEVDGGRYPARRIVGDRVAVEADIYTDGHDELAALLFWKREGETEWRRTPMALLVNDRWRGEFPVTELGRYRFTVTAWIDRFKTWGRSLKKWLDAGQDVSVDLLIGAELVREASRRATGDDARNLNGWATLLGGKGKMEQRTALALDERLAEAMARCSERHHEARYGRELTVAVDPPRARFSAWYEMFPRSCAPEPGRHGTLRDVERRLPYIARMGFDVLYLPPIHPIGVTHRKGANNITRAGRGDPGSPWAIGSRKGGHKTVNPRLGTLADFRRLLAKAREFGIEIALDVSLQASPDHPYMRSHPEWFRRRPDGTVQYAENPPKKYEDIYPFDFETPSREELYRELKSIFEFWIRQGVTIFRVDNPHTKPFHFWEWCLGELKAKHPEVIFLSEAFTRPKVMYRLAKVGFSQSYTYFPWRTARWELVEYFVELTRPPLSDFLRPSHWTNTPDILIAYLQHGGRPAFMARVTLAATLGASYGVYGPAFELMENRPLREGSEEYLDAEKYRIRHWDIDDPASLADYIARLNRIRRENPALQGDLSLRFHGCDNEQLICYSKSSEDRKNVILTAVNLDPHNTQAGWVHLDLNALGVDADTPFQVHDLLSDARYLWRGAEGYIELNPHVAPAHIFCVRHHQRREQDFDYYQ